MSDPIKGLAPPPTGSTGANTYSNLNGLEAIKRNPSSPQAIHAVAQQIDALFLQMMLKSMRDASAAMGQDDSNEMDMYHDMFDKQIALSMSQSHSLGLGAQLTRQMAAKAGIAAPAAAGSAPPAAGGASPPRPGAAQTDVTSLEGTSAAPAGGAQGAAPAGGAQSGGTQAGGTPAAAPPPGAANYNQAATPGQFVNQVFPAIQRAAQSLGVNPFVMLAQAVLETGWGKRMARSADGTPSLNMFGVKADDGWPGARMAAETVEFSGGVATQRRTAFRAYGSIEDSVNDFARLLGSSPRYREAVAAGGNAAAYVAAIGKSGYATDPAYANKLSEIMNSSKFRGALMAHILAL